MFKMSARVLETVIGEDDENVEAWYLLAFATCKLKKFTSAEECCKSVRDLMLKLKIADPELEQATMEIYDEVLKQKESAEKDGFEVVKGADGEDEDFETCSEESLSDDDGDDEEMKE